MDIATLSLPASTSGFWIRYAIVLILAVVTWSKMRTSLVGCTALGVCLAGLVSSFFENEQFAMLVLVLGLTIGPLAGVFLDTLMTRDRRTQCAIERRYARTFVCPACKHEFASIQRIGQCPRCECQFSTTE